MTRPIRIVLIGPNGHPDDKAARELEPGGPDSPAVTDLGRGRIRIEGTAHEAGAVRTGVIAAVPSIEPGGPRRYEVVVDGWRFELEVEDASRAHLRRRATRAADAAAASGPADIRAIIPGRIAAVRVTAGETVEAGQTLLVVEAMKMQNELRAPRSGTVERVAVGDGQTVDRGDLLLVLR
jgi:biotin carboxyl carrier protein